MEKYLCSICQKEFIDLKKFQHHIGWHKGFEKFHKQIKEKDLASKKERFFICARCQKEFTKILTNKEYQNYIKNHSLIFCSRSCANKRIHSSDTKLKISMEIKSNHSKLKKRICKICKKEYTLKSEGSTKSFCSNECANEYKLHRKKYLPKETIERMREGGKKSCSLSQQKRSKNEIAFCSLCEKHFKNVKHNEPIFNGWDADIIIEDLKIAILWNGNWHYQKIKKNHLLQQVQNRDQIKINEIKRAGFIPYVIEDRGKFSKEKVKKEFEKFLLFVKG